MYTVRTYNHQSTKIIIQGGKEGYQITEMTTLFWTLYNASWLLLYGLITNHELFVGLKDLILKH